MQGDGGWIGWDTSTVKDGYKISETRDGERKRNSSANTNYKTKIVHKGAKEAINEAIR